MPIASDVIGAGAALGRAQRTEQPLAEVTARTITRALQLLEAITVGGSRKFATRWSGAF
jgi:hypothetical protein